MHFLSTWDYLIIAAYLLACAGIGIYFKRRASQSMDEYYLGGRRMPWWLLGFAGMSSWFDVTGTVLICSFIYMIGPQALFIELRGGTGFVLAFLLVFMGKWHRRSGVMTKGEWMIYRFGPGFGGEAARVFAALSMVIFTTGVMAYLVRGTGQFLSMFVPLTPTWCALIVIIASAFYAAISGFYGVVWTDFFQSVIMLAGAVMIAVMGYLKFPDVAQVAATALEVTGQPNWINPIPSGNLNMPAGYTQYNMIWLLAGFYILRHTLGGLENGADPKYFGARSDRECGQLSYLWNWLIMFRWPMMMGFAMLGLVMVQTQFPRRDALVETASLVKQYYPDLTKNKWHDQTTLILHGGEEIKPELIAGLEGLLGEAWKAKLPLVSFEGTVDPEYVLPAVMLFYLPRGVSGFIFIAMLAAAMSTFSSFVNAAGPYFVRDIYHRFLRKRAGNRELIYVSWMTTFVIMGTGWGIAYLSENINDIWGFLIMAITVATSFGGVLRFYWWRLNGEGVAFGTLIGLLTATVIYIANKKFSANIEEIAQFVTVTSLTVGGSIIGSLLTKPTDEHVLTHFYRTTRPFGFWGRFKAALDPETRSKMEREHRNDLIALPIAIVWQHSIYIAMMLLVIRNWSALIATLVVFVVAQAGMHIFWYRKLPPHEIIAAPPDSGPPANTSQTT